MLEDDQKLNLCDVQRGGKGGFVGWLAVFNLNKSIPHLKRLLTKLPKRGVLRLVVDYLLGVVSNTPTLRIN